MGERLATLRVGGVAIALVDRDQAEIPVPVGDADRVLPGVDREVFLERLARPREVVPVERDPPDVDQLVQPHAPRRS